MINKYRRLMMDICNLLPHSQYLSKMRNKAMFKYIIDEVDLTGSTHLLFFDMCKHEVIFHSK